MTLIDPRREIPDRMNEDTGCYVWCLLGEDHDGPCLDDDDIAERKLQARDYDAWAAL